MMLPRIALALVGLVLAVRKLWRYRAGRRGGTMPPNARLRRAGRVLGVALVCGLVAYVLLPLRIERDWPGWLFYPFFALALLGVGGLYYGAFLFWGAETEPGTPNRDQAPDER